LGAAQDPGILYSVRQSHHMGGIAVMQQVHFTKGEIR
jgi:hypothetical protein